MAMNLLPGLRCAPHNYYAGIRVRELSTEHILPLRLPTPNRLVYRQQCWGLLIESVYGRNLVQLRTTVPLCTHISRPVTFLLWAPLSSLAYFPILKKKNRVGLWDHVALCVCVCLCIPPIVARQRLGKSPLIVARQLFGKNAPITDKQRHGRNVTAVTNRHATIEELLDASFSIWPVSCQGK
jgi:hypothetical protein